MKHLRDICRMLQYPARWLFELKAPGGLHHSVSVITMHMFVFSVNLGDITSPSPLSFYTLYMTNNTQALINQEKLKMLSLLTDDVEIYLALYF